MKNEIVERSPKSMKADVLDRVDIIINMISRKMKRAQIIAECRKAYSEWNVSDGSIDRYIAKAHEVLTDQVQATRQELRGEAANDLRYIYIKALEKEDYAVALRARKDLSELLCLRGLPGSKAEDEVPDAQEQEVLPDAVERVFEEAMVIENPLVRPDEVVDLTWSKDSKPVKSKSKADDDGPRFASLGY